ncbi:hypothetical protein ACET3X_007056 [Alternaria dauci]|uniref:C2H2-type domain-containing protein n=1 Tax=Alternaria dauci TaxID=48095 RepID=A0ABR3UFH8_9PLEO
MMAVPNDGSYKLTCSFDDMSYPNDPNDDETYHTPNTTDERTFAWASQSNSLPPEDLAAYIWPPSVYEAAQNVYLTSLPPRHPYIPVGYHTMSVGEPWQPSLAATSSYSDRSRHLEQLQVNSRNGPDSGGLLGLSYTGLRQDSTTGNPTPPASDTANDRDTSSHIVNDKSSLRCLVCLDKPAFTGQYAQRNLNRHMAKHEPCVGQGNNRHIRCEQPGCTSTFGREDALLVHLRRSHPELNTPPAKKRKR